MELLTPDQWRPLVDELLRGSEKPLIVILGPTASGKSAFSINVAGYIAEDCASWKGAEVINADSRQLYRHLDIGTAKITESERGDVPHHLLDVLEPNEEVTIASYKKMAADIIDDCHARRRVPLLVGGSMLYVSAVVDGLEPLPAAPPELRAKLEAAWDEDDGWTLYDRLVEIDPAIAKSFEKQNKVYVVRAMELYEMTGKPPSTLKKTMPPPYNVLQLGLRWPRDLLVRRIDERTATMLRSGWIEEVEGLIDRGYTPRDPAMKSHGYKEIMQWLGSEERNMEHLEMMIGAKTRQYAKRQMTWWDEDERIRWIDAPRMFGY